MVVMAPPSPLSPLPLIAALFVLLFTYSSQKRVEVTVLETQRIVSRSEGVARQLRWEMGERAAELSTRRTTAEEGLTVRENRSVGILMCLLGSLELYRNTVINMVKIFMGVL